MLTEIANVIKVDGHQAWCEADRKTVCGSCQASKGCGVPLIDNIFSPKPVNIRIKHDNCLKIGDRVEIGVDKSAFLHSSLLVYLLPIIFMLVFAMIAQGVSVDSVIAEANVIETMGYNEAIIIAYALAGLIFGFFCVYVISRKLATNAAFQAVLIRKIEN